MNIWPGGLSFMRPIAISIWDNGDRAKPLFEQALTLIPPEAEATRQQVLLVLAQQPAANSPTA